MARRGNGYARQVTAWTPTLVTAQAHALVTGLVTGPVAGSGAAEPSQLLPAREQMAFTLGFHIILVPFGVAFTFMMLVANYRGIRHGDDATRCCWPSAGPRWRRCCSRSAPCPGTVLSFEMGLLWPGLMGRYGAAYGIPFAVEGIFFFLEAIFVAIYIYGWKRLRPWPHFWTGVPVVLAGSAAPLGRGGERLDEPAGRHHGRATAGSSTSTRCAVFFNGAFWYEALHMLLAAYIVAGFLVAGSTRSGMLRGRRDRYHRLGLPDPVHHRGGRHAGPDLRRRRRRPRGVPPRAGQVRRDRGAARRPPPTCPRRSAASWSTARSRYGIAIPGGASLLAGYSPDTGSAGLDAIPAAVRPADRLVNTVHLAFDVDGRHRVPAARRSRSGSASPGGAAGTCRRAAGSCGAPPSAACVAVVALEAGWVVTEVGRQPWTVGGPAADPRTPSPRAGNVWLFFAATLVIYAAIGSARSCVLRSMRRRWRGGRRVRATCPSGQGGRRAPRGPREARRERAGRRRACSPA